jgi:hypothetical protein
VKARTAQFEQRHNYRSAENRTCSRNGVVVGRIFKVEVRRKTARASGHTNPDGIRLELRGAGVHAAGGTFNPSEGYKN